MNNDVQEKEIVNNMTSEEYKNNINQRDVLDHTTLDVTLKEMASRQEFDLAGKLKSIMDNNKMPKPELHSKPYDHTTNYYKVDLSDEDIDKIIDIFFDLEASHVSEDGNTTPTASFYASLVDKWNTLKH